MRIGFKAFAGLLVALLTVGSVSAHHGSAGYRADKVLVLKEATVTKFLWTNPHGFVMFAVKDDKGNVVNWSGETGSPSALRQVGWNKDSVRAGDIVTVYIFPSKFASRVGLVDKIVFADGRTLRDSARGDGGDINRY